MNREDIIRMAREAGAVFPADGSYHKFEFEGSLERFFKAAYAAGAAAEREKHKASIEFLSRTVDIYKAEVDALHQEQRNDIAAAIRARGQQ